MILSDSEDDVNDKEDSKQSKTSNTNGNKELRKVVSPGDLFGKKPITRVEEAKVKKLQKIVSIVRIESSSINQNSVNNTGICRKLSSITMMILILY